MRLVVIYDHAGRAIAELDRVLRGEVQMSGALVVTYGDPARPARHVQAPGTWNRVDDWHNDDGEPAENGAAVYATSPAGDPYDRLHITPPAEPDDPTMPLPPDMAGLSTGPRHAAAVTSWAAVGLDALVRPLPPGPPEPVLPVDGLAMPDGARLAAALLIACRCAELRCPVVLNPSTPAERRAWADRQRGGAGAAVLIEPETWPTPAPREQCVMERGHAIVPEDAEHVWREGAWPYGADRHHPRCPRYHGRWNAPYGEGQPALLAPAGATSQDGWGPFDRGPEPLAAGTVPAGVEGVALGRAAQTDGGDPDRAAGEQAAS